MLKRPAVAALTLLCFALTYVYPQEAVYASVMAELKTPRRNAGPGRVVSPAQRLVAELLQLERLLDHLQTKESPAKKDLESLRQAYGILQTEGDKVLRKLDGLSERLRQSNAPATIRDRHRQEKERIGQGLGKLIKNLQLMEAGSKNWMETLVAARGQLTDALGPSRYNPLDPNHLPFRPHKAEPAKPRTESVQFRSSLGSSVVVERSTAPLPADLAGNLDVQLSADIQALAASLGKDPLRIYNWVRQNIQFVPTFGSIQGSEGCRLSRECNAHDAASLLIALFRASGVPARYVLGTVELEPSLFRSAMGDFQDLRAAGRLAASGGIPTTFVGGTDGQIVAVRLEHVWVEAFVSFVPSRGAGAGTGSTWVPLDPVLKRTRFQAPADVGALTGTSLRAIVDDMQASAVVGPGGSVTSIPSAANQDRIYRLVKDFEAAVAANMPEATIGEVIGAVEIQAVPVAVLPASLQARIVTVGGRMAELPGASRHQITIQGLDQFGSESFRVERATAQLANKRLTLHYLPATADDISIVESFGGLFETPPHLVNLRPTFFIEGQPVATGSPLRMGTTQRIRVSFREPGWSDQVEHKVSAGSFAALGLDLQQIGEAQIQQRRDRLQAIRDQLANMTADSSWDDLIGEPLHLHAQSYFLQAEAANRIAGNAMNVAALKRPAEGLVTYAPQFSYLFGTAVDVSGTGFNIDVRRYVVSTASRVGDADRELAYMLSTGGYGSAAEHTVFEHVLRARSVSAIKLLGEANARGIPVFKVDSSNLSQILPLLNVPSAVRSDVINSVSAGKLVMIPQQQMTYLEWQGLGYIVLDPETGAAGYMISGGLAGGGTAEDSEGGGAFANLIAILTFVANELGGIVKAGSKVLIGIDKIDGTASVFGKIIIGISALVTAYSVYQKTGSLWKALVGGVIDLVVSIAVGALITFLAGLTFFTGGLGLVLLFVAILAISYIAYLLVSFLTGLLGKLLWWFRRENERLARRLESRDRTFNGPPLPSAGWTPAWAVA